MQQGLKVLDIHQTSGDMQHIHRTVKKRSYTSHEFLAYCSSDVKHLNNKQTNNTRCEIVHFTSAFAVHQICTTSAGTWELIKQEQIPVLTVKKSAL